MLRGNGRAPASAAGLRQDTDGRRRRSVNGRRALLAAALLTVAVALLAPGGVLAAAQAPSVYTERATSVDETSATLNGTVDPNEAEITECKFEYGTTTAYGSSASCASLPGSGNSEVGVSAEITGLDESTTYHYRIVAKNSEGTTVGTDRKLTTLPNLPIVATGDASAISETGATLNGIVNPNGEAVTECKFEYGTTLAYGNSVDCTSLPGSGTSEVGVSAPVTGLSVSTTYHFRLVATNELGTTYGGDHKFRTKPSVPIVVTLKASAVDKTTATLNANVNPQGRNVTECKFEYGTSLSYGKTAACSSLPGSGEGPVGVSASLTGLSESTLYHFRIVAANSLGTSFGGDRKFTTLPRAAVVVTEQASAVGKTEATLNGSVNPNDGNVTECKFEYGTNVGYGSSANCSSLPGSGKKAVEVMAEVSGLKEDTTYHYRLVATSSAGTVFGLDRTFTTLPRAPKAVTEAASSVGATTATFNATVNPHGSNVTECKFEYGTNVGYGSSASCAFPPGSGVKGVAVFANVSGLSGGTTYHFRITATNSVGVAFGADAKFTTGLAGREPVVKKVSPKKGSIRGGTPVSISGKFFEGATAVMFGSTEVTPTVNSATSISVIAPAHPAETVDVRVVTPNGTSAITSKDHFKYKAP
jgi:phosphodiesterase/alkaline phosphatase D-like protein